MGRAGHFSGAVDQLGICFNNKAASLEEKSGLGGSRTHTPERTHEPESCLSTSSSTRPLGKGMQIWEEGSKKPIP